MTGSTKSERGISRRELLRDAAAAGAAATLSGTVLARPARGATGKTVAILGGGMAGLAAAHELAERGFSVTVYERRAWGGKARSIDTPETPTSGRKPLPGEHGFRFFPGFYHNVPDTMERIPFPGNRNGVHDNFSSVPLAVAALEGAEDLTVPFGLLNLGNWLSLTPDKLIRDLGSATNILTHLPINELGYFINRLFVFFTSCDARRLGEWEYTSWQDFIKPQGKSPYYTKLLVNGLTRVLVAARPDKASTRTIATMGEAFVLSLFGLGNDGSPDRVLNGPTNEAWIDPWVAYLQKIGVSLKLGWEAQGFTLDGGKIAGATVKDPSGTTGDVTADYYICALPPERAVKLFSPEMRALDDQFARVEQLLVDWMTGIQFYLTRNAPLAKAHMAYMDSPWAVTSINQAQFWKRNLPQQYGDGTVQDILSCDISDWNTPGVLYGKTAKQCTPEQVAKEAWEQIKRHVPKGALRDEDLHSWFLDSGLQWNAATGTYTNDDPLLVNTAGSWDNRPDVRTKIPNLYLAGDYIRTNVNLATMEGANEAARLAVNALLHDSGSSAAQAKVFTLLNPWFWEGARREDARRYAQGLPNKLDHG